ncbi:MULTISPECIES: nucleotide exchange factor GrpE [unclassified Nodularia (in: cyanobacteria)]|uniref:nucleotide exchange factor GrpE n=1 Tax=unclassified Nodularia (in: cyanobacteria) TaxID=2656917 RepID=UPI00187DEF56|nr:MULTISPECIES: nucleotide exchange factor GrpE [unclassified Nodularia (in: cyanobacteria)]MBE9198279.1 nucleotide exchange factor GrpE [Nodularia sp. LEGE 06071]MCC2693115.1 nucleotide exchange factor GrpE [Nodularia sp. LEGE 04288]
MTNDTQKLQNLMQRVSISSFKGLSRDAGVSERQILRLRQGKLEQMRVDVLFKLSQVLKISLSELIETFSPLSCREAINPVSPHSPPPSQKEIAELKAEYQRSQLQLEQQREILTQEFQQSSLQLLESLLLQWPTAAQKAQENPQLAAIKIVPLVQKPLERLLQEWGIQAIAPVGAEVPYNPQIHQFIEGTAQPGETVKVRYTGYLQGEKLLYRAKVSPV